MAQCQSPILSPPGQYLRVKEFVCQSLSFRLLREDFSSAKQENLAAARLEFICSVSTPNPFTAVSLAHYFVKPAEVWKEKWNTPAFKSHLAICCVKPNIANGHIYAYRHWLCNAMDEMTLTDSFVFTFQLMEWLHTAVKGLLIDCTSPEEGNIQIHDLCGLVAEMIMYYETPCGSTLSKWMMTKDVMKKLFLKLPPDQPTGLPATAVTSSVVRYSWPSKHPVQLRAPLRVQPSVSLRPLLPRISNDYRWRTKPLQPGVQPCYLPTRPNFNLRHVRSMAPSTTQPVFRLAGPRNV